MEKTYSEKYAEQDRICTENKAIVEFFLRNFREKHPELELGTRFYTDVTVLSGPNAQEGYRYLTEKRPEWYERYKKNDLHVYNIKWAGATFVIERKKIFFDDGKIYFSPLDVPVSATMICEGQEYAVPVEIASAVMKLYSAQEYRSAIYGAHQAQLEYILRRADTLRRVNAK